MFVRLRHSLSSVQVDMEIREMKEMLNQPMSDEDDG